MRDIGSTARRVAPTPGDEPVVLLLRDGATARIEGDALALRDGEGRLLVRYLDGAAEIAAPRGDLTLSAPEGRVRIRSGEDVVIEAARDVVHAAGRRVDLHAGSADAPQLRVDPRGAEVRVETLEVAARVSRVVTGSATVVANALTSTAERIALSAERYELVATRVVERTRDSFREATDLAETCAGRLRAIVKDAYSLHARRTAITSEEETQIDGSKVLLG